MLNFRAAYYERMGLDAYVPVDFVAVRAWFRRHERLEPEYRWQRSQGPRP